MQLSEKEIAKLRAQKAVMAEALRYVESHFEDLAHGKTFIVGPSTDQAWARVREALSASPKLLWSGKAELHNGMLCHYLGGDPGERVQAPDQDVDVLVLAHEQGQESEHG